MLVPSIGIRNIRARINFGNEPFFYHMPGWPLTCFRDPSLIKPILEAPKKTQAQIDQERKEQMAVETVFFRIFYHCE
jgi:hypothetical protein